MMRLIPIDSKNVNGKPRLQRPNFTLTMSIPKIPAAGHLDGVIFWDMIYGLIGPILVHCEKIKNIRIFSSKFFEADLA